MTRDYEYERLCRRCNRNWFVPADVAEGRPRQQAKMAGWLTPIVGSKRQALRSQQAMVDLHNQRLADAGRCPHCGSSSYWERRVSV